VGADTHFLPPAELLSSSDDDENQDRRNAKPTFMDIQTLWSGGAFIKSSPSTAAKVC